MLAALPDLQDRQADFQKVKISAVVGQDRHSNFLAALRSYQSKAAKIVE